MKASTLIYVLIGSATAVVIAAILVPKFRAYMKSKVAALARFAAAALPYLYFMRFSLFLWLSMILFILLDAYTGVSTATRGIVTLENWGQFLSAAFIVTLAGWVALLSARIVCAYGQERFGNVPPSAFKIGASMSFWTFFGAQLPGALLMAYVFFCSHCDGRQPWWRIFAILLGFFLAFCCWCCLTAFYYWSYQGDDELVEEERMKSEERAIRNKLRETSGPLALAMPICAPNWMQILQRAEPPAIARVFDGLFSWFAKRFGPGFAKGTPAAGKPAPLNSGHQLAILTLTFLLVVYFSLSYNTAPVEMPTLRMTLRTVLVITVAAWFLFAILYRPFNPPLDGSKQLSRWQSVLLALLVLLPIWILDVLVFFGGQTHHGFAVLALVYILLTFVFWGLSGLAFILDRFRVPVFTAVLAIELVLGLVLPHLWAGRFQVEHIVQTKTVPAPPDDGQPSSPSALRHPDAILQAFLQSRPAKEGNLPPLIIVTATGGGIHAANWTAQVMAQLEEDFAKDPGVVKWNEQNPNHKITFHNSILMLSSASGGSVGFESWLREYQTPNAFSNLNTVRTQVTQATACSSLEAIAWGLVYPDFIHLLFPFPILENYDRGWALQAALQRNHFDSRDCQVIDHQVPADVWLTDLVRALGQASEPKVPAFSLNTTVTETGDRLLLANYRVRFSDKERSEVLPADSFMDAYHVQGGKVLDLPIEAAARLSATFPYVSPMPRIQRDVKIEVIDPKTGKEDPDQETGRAYHFADGGYYDNDGTASAMEFLAQAYCLDLKAVDELPNEAVQRECHQPPNKPLQVIWIEIRDGDSPTGNYRPDRADHQNLARIWNSSDQLLGPLTAFYNAGHGSVTRRNRNTLCLLERALDPDRHQPNPSSSHARVVVRHYIFSYEREKGKLCCSPHAASWSDPDQKPGFHLSDLAPNKAAQPLNWRLTAADRDEIALQSGATPLTEAEKRNAPAFQAGNKTARLAQQIAGDFAAAVNGKMLPDTSNCENIPRDPIDRE